MKYQIDFDQWLDNLTADELADTLVELDTEQLTELAWALITGRNDLITAERKRYMRTLDDRYQWLAADEDPSVVYWGE